MINTHLTSASVQYKETTFYMNDKRNRWSPSGAK